MNNKPHTEEAKRKISESRKGKGLHKGTNYIDKPFSEIGEWGIRPKLIRNGLIVECEGCGSVKKLQVHHVDGDRNNNVLDNISILCSKCHAHLHKNWEKRWKK